jgi:hypothetical protein
MHLSLPLILVCELRLPMTRRRAWLLYCFAALNLASVRSRKAPRRIFPPPAKINMLPGRRPD